jgi:pimeloyl-ACP methyl ester carboxylesterase
VSARRFDIRVDVSAALPGETSLEVAAWLFAPPEGATPRALLVCSHVGGFTRHYWHLEDQPDYSFAEYMAHRGYPILAYDRPGAGESGSFSDARGGTTAALAAAAHVLVQKVGASLAEGTLAPELAPMPKLSAIGIGHSFGAWITLRQQARHESFQAIAILGNTARTVQHSEALAAIREQTRPLIESYGAIAPEEIERRLAHDLPRPFGGAPQRGKDVLRLYYLDDVPHEVIAADLSHQSRIGGAAGYAALIPDAFASDAAAIGVPLFLGFAERDVSPDPWAEPQFYRKCRDISLYVLRGSGHMHNAAATRERLWAMIHEWVSRVSANQITPSDW